MAEAIKVMQQRVEKRKAIADPDLENENDEKEGDEIEVLKRQKKIAGHQVKNKPDREAVQGIITKMQTEVSAYNLSELDSFVVKPNKELSELTKQLTMELNHATPGFVAVVMKQIAVAIRKRRFDLQEAIKAEAIKKQKERADAALVALKERKFQEEQNPTTTFEKAKSEEEEAKMTPAERRAALNASYEPMRDCVGQVIVKMLTDKMINVDINPATLVSDVMDAITDAEGIPPDQQRLIFSGKQLEAEQFLSALKIRNMDIIHIVLRLRGGMFDEVAAVRAFHKLLQENSHDDALSIETMAVAQSILRSTHYEDQMMTQAEMYDELVRVKGMAFPWRLAWEVSFLAPEDLANPLPELPIA